jgi:hypothetical protein
VFHGYLSRRYAAAAANNSRNGIANKYGIDWRKHTKKYYNQRVRAVRERLIALTQRAYKVKRV